MKIIQLIKNIKNKLIKVCKSKHEAEQQAWWLIEKLTSKDQTKLLLEENINLNIKQKNILDNWLNDLVINNKPIQYILEQVPFCNINIIVKPPILIPRPETEQWTTWVIKKLALRDARLKPRSSGYLDKLNILDIGTGSGCIALAIAKSFPNFNITATDVNPKAIELAKENAKLNNIKNVEFIISDFYKNINSNLKFDLIVSNPPYISEKEWITLNPNITKWEDKKALVANKNGFAAFEIIIKNAKNFLTKNKELEKFEIPQIIIELGKGQEEVVKSLFVKNNFKKIEIWPDFAKINRWITAIL